MTVAADGPDLVSLITANTPAIELDGNNTYTVSANLIVDHFLTLTVINADATVSMTSNFFWNIRNKDSIFGNSDGSFGLTISGIGEVATGYGLLRIYSTTTTTDTPVFHYITFKSTSATIPCARVGDSSSTGTANPIFNNCLFSTTGPAGTARGVVLVTDQPHSYTVTFNICIFDNCDQGILVTGDLLAEVIVNTNGCTFTDMSTAAVNISPSAGLCTLNSINDVYDDSGGNPNSVGLRVGASVTGQVHAVLNSCMFDSCVLKGVSITATSGTDVTVTCIDCEAFNAGSGGVGDGFSIDGDAVATMILINCKAYDNADDGFTMHHAGNTMIIIGGSYYGNKIGGEMIGTTDGDGSILSIDGALIYDNTTTGLRCQHSSRPIVKNCVFDSNVDGFQGTMAPFGFFNNIFTNHTGTAIKSDAVGVPMYGVGDYNCFFGNNADFNATDDAVNTNDIELDPLYVDADNDNYVVASNSPCLNAGMPAMPTGFASIGAYQAEQGGGGGITRSGLTRYF